MVLCTRCLNAKRGLSLVLDVGAKTVGGVPEIGRQATYIPKQR